MKMTIDTTIVTIHGVSRAKDRCNVKNVHSAETVYVTPEEIQHSSGAIDACRHRIRWYWPWIWNGIVQMDRPFCMEGNQRRWRSQINGGYIWKRKGTAHETCSGKSIIMIPKARRLAGAVPDSSVAWTTMMPMVTRPVIVTVHSSGAWIIMTMLDTKPDTVTVLSAEVLTITMNMVIRLDIVAEASLEEWITSARVIQKNKIKYIHKAATYLKYPSSNRFEYR